MANGHECDRSMRWLTHLVNGRLECGWLPEGDTPTDEGVNCSLPGLAALAWCSVGRIDRLTSMLERIEGNGVRTIVVNTAHRAACDLKAAGG